jgi:hypothetical protein
MPRRLFLMREQAKVEMTVEDALDYSVGRILLAIEGSRGAKREAIVFANWPDTAHSLRRAIDQLPKNWSSRLLKQKIYWSEHYAEDDLYCGSLAVDMVEGAVSLHLFAYGKKTEAFDILRGAHQDAKASFQDLAAARKDKK